MTATKTGSKTNTNQEIKNSKIACGKSRDHMPRGEKRTVQLDRYIISPLQLIMNQHKLAWSLIKEQIKYITYKLQLQQEVRRCSFLGKSALLTKLRKLPDTVAKHLLQLKWSQGAKKQDRKTTLSKNKQGKFMCTKKNICTLLQSGPYLVVRNTAHMIRLFTDVVRNTLKRQRFPWDLWHVPIVKPAGGQLSQVPWEASSL